MSYIHYYGDGDNKSYSTVKNVYKPHYEIDKFECIGHVLKRVGCRLRKSKREKIDFGRGELKYDVIDRIQNYYGIAIRSNVGKLQSMNQQFLLHYSMLHPLLKMYGMTIVQKVLVAGVVTYGIYLIKQVCINQV